MEIALEKRRAKCRLYYRKNRAKLLEQKKVYYEENKEQINSGNRRRHYLRKYGITLEQRNELIRSQGGACAICEKRLLLNVDHDHSTGEVRGMLCTVCNMLLGYLETQTMNATFVEKAEAYAKKPLLKRLREEPT